MIYILFFISLTHAPSCIIIRFVVFCCFISSKEFMQYLHANNSFCIDMERIHAVSTCKEFMQYLHVKNSCNIYTAKKTVLFFQLLASCELLWLLKHPSQQMTFWILTLFFRENKAWHIFLFFFFFRKLGWIFHVNHLPDICWFTWNIKPYFLWKRKRK